MPRRETLAQSLVLTVLSLCVSSEVSNEYSPTAPSATASFDVDVTNSRYDDVKGTGQRNGGTMRTDEGSKGIVPPGYLQEMAPLPIGGGPLLVNFSMKVNGIVEADQRQTAVMIDSYFRVTWVDWRLRYPGHHQPQPTTGDSESDVTDEGAAGCSVLGECEVENMIIDPVVLQKLWLPDPYIFNVKSVNTVTMLKDVQGVLMYSDNTIFISSALKIELDCSRTFARFPFDIQECPVDILSYMYTLREIEMRWLAGGLVVDPRVRNQLSNFHFEFKALTDNISCYCYKCIPPDAPCVRATLILSRKVLGHLLATFLPSGLFVGVSWASLFWPADVIPGRTVLVITSLLTLVSMHTAVRQSTPETSYVKAVDVWMFMCIVFSVLTLFEYGIVLFVRKNRPTRVVPIAAPIINKTTGVPDLTSISSSSVDWFSEERIEQGTRISLPILFILFNAVYWPYYLL